MLLIEDKDIKDALEVVEANGGGTLSWASAKSIEFGFERAQFPQLEG